MYKNLDPAQKYSHGDIRDSKYPYTLLNNASKQAGTSLKACALESLIFNRMAPKISSWVSKPQIRTRTEPTQL